MDESLKRRLDNAPAGEVALTPEDLINRAIASLNLLTEDQALEAVNNCEHAKYIANSAVEDAKTDGAVRDSADNLLLDDADSRVLDNLQRAIVCGDIAEALDLLRDIAPSHSFLTVRAESQLAIGRREKVLI